mmetsp:Transcript_3535/g.10925  ORF Transcript_3535/g.10925 Transcript_3535/m.10925 type:complete len:83 (-) Transcript_3535:16-264(-)
MLTACAAVRVVLSSSTTLPPRSPRVTAPSRTPRDRRAYGSPRRDHPISPADAWATTHHANNRIRLRLVGELPSTSAAAHHLR